MNKKLKLALSLFIGTMTISSNALPVLACQLSKEELIEKYSYLCNIHTDSNMANYYATEKNGDASYMPNTGVISESGVESGFFYDVINNAFIRITGANYSEFDTNTTILQIPDTIKGLPVKEIGYRAFCRASENLSHLQEVRIPQSVEIIAERAFSRVFCALPDIRDMSQEQRNNYHINIPENIRFIGYRAFFASAFAVANTYADDRVIHLPESLEYISSQAFDGEIQTRAFGAIEVDMPESLVFMSNDTFWTSLPFNSEVKINWYQCSNLDVFSDDIPADYIPLMRSICGKGFYNAERNIITMKDILRTNMTKNKMELPEIVTQNFSYNDYADKDTACSFDEFGSFESKMDYWIYRANQNAPDLLPTPVIIEKNASTNIILSSDTVGDVNGDSAIDVTDAVILARFCTEDNTAVITNQGKQNADVNQDNNITLDDVTAILRKVAKLG